MTAQYAHPRYLSGRNFSKIIIIWKEKKKIHQKYIIKQEY